VLPAVLATCNASPVQVKPLSPNPMYNPCPEYLDLACCNSNQLLQVGVQLALSASAFGNPAAGGCPACGENLRMLWCSLTCHPNQSLIVSPEPYSIKKTVSGTTYDVMPANISIGSRYACGMFDSCKGTTSASQEPSLQTSVQSFLDFMGQAKAAMHGVWYTFFFYDDALPLKDQIQIPAPPKMSMGVAAKREGGNLDVPGVDVLNAENNVTYCLNPDLQFCCNYNGSLYEKYARVPPPGGIPKSGNLSCPCQYCKSSCYGAQCPASGASHASFNPAALTAPMYGVWNGFDVVTVPSVFGLAILLTIGSMVVQGWAKKQLVPTARTYSA
jgi:hypothetical protein